MDDDVIVVRTNEPQPEPALPDGVVFRVIDTPLDALRIARAYARAYSWRATLKMLAKTATARRSYWVAMCDGQILSDGWIQKGYYRHHPIGPDDYVLESMHTVPSARGLGLAHSCLVRAINLSLRRGAPWVYGDTTRANVASWKVCMKSGYRPL